MLRGPSYTPPTRQRLSQDLLPKLFDELMTEIRGKVVGRNVTLVIDGWKDVKNDPTLGYGLAQGGRHWLYLLEGTLGTPHTIDNLGPMVLQVWLFFPIRQRSQ